LEFNFNYAVLILLIIDQIFKFFFYNPHKNNRSNKFS